MTCPCWLCAGTGRQACGRYCSECGGFGALRAPDAALATTVEIPALTMDELVDEPVRVAEEYLALHTWGPS